MLIWFLSSVAASTPSYFGPDYYQIAIGSLGRTALLFTAGLAFAHIGMLFREAGQRILWDGITVEHWCMVKFWLPTSLIATGILIPFLLVNIFDRVFDNGLIYIRMSLLLLGALSSLAGVLASPPKVKEAMSNFSLLGKLSYSLYLLHMSVIFAVGMPVYLWINPVLTPSVRFASIVMICILPMFLLSYIFWVCVEDPLGIRLPNYAFKGLWKIAGFIQSQALDKLRVWLPTPDTMKWMPQMMSVRQYL
jgi:peptidoglycan/LPS O-acetylase OafA/YrhL